MNERLDKQNEKIEEKLGSLAIEEEVQKRLDTKSPKTDYGNLYKQILQFNIDLNPLIEKGHTLKKFID